jgi:GT2 family glycosyltransferase
MPRIRIGLIDALSTDGWHGPSHALQQAARALSGSGHEVMAIDASHIGSDEPPVLLTAQNRATATRHMLASHRLAMKMADAPPDLIIAPLRGGIAQAALMARACGEAFSRTRFALWSNEPSRDLVVGGDAPVGDLSPLIADAMERQCLSLADCLIVDDASKLPASLGERVNELPHIACRRLPGPTPAWPGTEVREIVFVGAFQRSRGAPEFIEVIERLERRGQLGGRLVSFVGPIGDSRYGLSKEWLGQRAARWSFRFRVVPEPDREAALAYAAQSGRLAVVISTDREELDAVRSRCPRHVAHQAQPMSGSDLVPDLMTAISSALQGVGLCQPQNSEIDWNGLLEVLIDQPIRARPTSPPSVSVCVLHHDRLALLKRALSSIPESIDGRDVEIIVIDNASPMSGVKDQIEAVAGKRQRLKVRELREQATRSAAYNEGFAMAEGDVVAFLDDDNFYVPGGLERLALATSVHDIVVSNLDVFDDNDATASAGRLLFLGEAHSAGLFYNFIGDTAMAVRREAFAAHGGFHDLGCEYPSFDWVSLAKAYGLGLRIGVLQWPAVRYRRDTARADNQAIKLDVASARALVFKAYRGRFDAELVVRYAQNLELGDL